MTSFRPCGKRQISALQGGAKILTQPPGQTSKSHAFTLNSSRSEGLKKYPNG